MPKTTEARVQDGTKEYRKVGWECSLELATELIATNCDPDDPRVFCAISALSNFIGHEPGSPERAMLDALDNPDGLNDEDFWNELWLRCCGLI